MDDRLHRIHEQLATVRSNIARVEDMTRRSRESRRIEIAETGGGEFNEEECRLALTGQRYPRPDARPDWMKRDWWDRALLEENRQMPSVVLRAVIPTKLLDRVKEYARERKWTMDETVMELLQEGLPMTEDTL